MVFFFRKSKNKQTSVSRSRSSSHHHHHHHRVGGKEALLLKSVRSSDDADLVFEASRDEDYEHQEEMKKLHPAPAQFPMEILRRPSQEDETETSDQEEKLHRFTSSSISAPSNRIRLFHKNSSRSVPQQLPLNTPRKDERRIVDINAKGGVDRDHQDENEQETTKDSTLSPATTATPSPERFRFRKNASNGGGGGGIMSFSLGSGSKKKKKLAQSQQSKPKSIAILQPPPQDGPSNRRNGQEEPVKNTSPTRLNHEPEVPPPAAALMATNDLLQSLSFQGSWDNDQNDSSAKLQGAADDQSIEILTPDAQRRQKEERALLHPLQNQGELDDDDDDDNDDDNDDEPQNQTPNNESLSKTLFPTGSAIAPSPIEMDNSPVYQSLPRQEWEQQRRSSPPKDDQKELFRMMPSRDPPTLDEDVDLMPVELAPTSPEKYPQEGRDTSTTRMSETTSVRKGRRVSAVDELLGETGGLSSPVPAKVQSAQQSALAKRREVSRARSNSQSRYKEEGHDDTRTNRIQTADTRTVGTETGETYRDDEETYDSRTQNSDGSSIRQEFRQVLDDTVQKVIETFRCNPNVSAKQVLANPTGVMSLFYDRLCTPAEYQKESKRPYFNEEFTREWIYKMTTKGISVLYLQAPHSPGNSLPEWKGRSVQLKIATGSTGNLTDIQPKLEWSTMAGGKSSVILTTSVPLLKIHSILTTSGDGDDMVEELGGTFLTITSESGDVHMFEANSVEERDDILNGLRNVITRLSFHLITGDATASVELYRDDNGLEEGDLPSLPNPRLNMNRIAHALLDG